MRADRGNITRVLASLVLAGLLSFIPGFFLFQNIRDSAGMHRLTAPKILSSSTDNYYGSPREIYSAKASDLCVTFGFLTLDPTSSAATFTILLGVTDQGIAYLRNLAGTRHRPRYKSVSLVISSNFGLSSIEISVPLSVLEHSRASACENGSVTRKELLQGAGFQTVKNIFVLGQPRAFPDDWYEVNDTIHTCATRKSQDECLTGRQSQDVKLPSSLIIMTRDEDLSMSVGVAARASQLEFIIRRPVSIVIYTYWVAAMPFVLLIGLFGAYLYRRNVNTAEKEVPRVYEVAFGVAATMVAILPLRAVLVPSSLPNLTRLDIVFSTGVTLLVAFSLVWAHIWRTHKRSPAGQDGAEMDERPTAGPK